MNKREALSPTFAILTRALRPFVELHLRRVYGDGWESAAKRSTSLERGGRHLDLAALLSAIHSNRSVFTGSLPHVGQAYVTEIREMRNKWAHQESIDDDDADRTLGTAIRLLRCIRAEAEQLELESLKSVAAPDPPNGLVQIARKDRCGVYTEEDLDYEHARKEGNFLLFKSYDLHGQVVNVKIHVDVVIEGAFGEIPAEQGVGDEDAK